MTETIDVAAILADVIDHEYDESPSAEPAKPDPYIAALPVSSLFADPTYQRELDSRRTDKMADQYQVALIGIIEVSARPNGRHAILDGQHRAAVVRTVAFGSATEDPHVPCRIHTGLSVAEEAQLYHQLNTTRRQLTGWDRWIARRGAGDPAALAIEACASRHGIAVGMTAGTNVLRATASCEKVVTLGGIPLLDEVLSTIRQTWPDDQAGLDGAIVHGLGHVLNAYSREELDLARLVAGLSAIVPRQLTARAAAVRELHQGTVDRLAAHVIVERYNGVSGRGRIQAFFDRVKPLTQAQTEKHKAKVEHRERILKWARESGWEGRTDRLSPRLRDAYEAAHGRALATAPQEPIEEDNR